MKQPLSKKRIDFLKGPALGVLYTLKHLRSPLLLAGIAAALVAGTIGVLCYLFSFFMEPDLLMFLFRPLIIATPLAGAVVAALMAFDFSKLDQITFRRRTLKHVENSDTNLEPESVCPA